MIQQIQRPPPPQPQQDNIWQQAGTAAQHQSEVGSDAIIIPSPFLSPSYKSTNQRQAGKKSLVNKCVLCTALRSSAAPTSP
mmetsp:Transcript_19098/g.32769  ORF Transcript_19098/g.32769 Transcript_19098/m.32769 type:complete len:81 (+) Transcript_19098:212-454(+)